MALLVSASRNYAASPNDGSPDSVAYSANVTAGNLLVVVVRMREGSGAVTGVSGVGAAANGAFSLAAAQGPCAIYYKQNCNGGAETVEVSFTASANWTTYIDVLEFSGIATTGALDQSGNNTGSGTSVTWPALSATGAGFVIAAASLSGTPTKSSLAAGYTAIPSSPADGADSSRFFGAYRYNTGAETTNAAVTLGTSVTQYLAIANFLDAAGSASITPHADFYSMLRRNN